MKNAVRLPGILFLIMSTIPFSFGCLAGQSQTGRASPIPGDFPSATRTPVYSKWKTGIVAILEIDYPDAAINFADLFPSAVNPLWILESGTLFVSFVKSGNKVSAAFAPSGAMNYSITCLSPTDIPFTIREKLSIGYGAYSILSAKEITAGTDMVYQVILEGRHEYIIMQIGDTEIKESKRVKK